MSIKHCLLAYVLVALAFLSLDAVWLGTMAPRLYRPALGHLMAERVGVGAAALFYALYVAGVVYFAVRGAVAAGSPLHALRDGALLGLLAYATYDLTNQATLKAWPWRVTLVDLAWGTLATGVAAGVAGWALLRSTRG